MAKLLLFDVDGTLMITKGAGSRCILRACKQVFGQAFEWGPITVGTLDPQIFADLCRHNGVENPGAYHERYQAVYFKELENELALRREDVTVMPGIAELLAGLQGRAGDLGGIVLGIVTGNYREATRIKLSAAGIGLSVFNVVACCEDGSDRPELVRVAISRAGLPLKAEDVTLIGDTPRDIECAHANGCRALAVATGRYSVDQLREAAADHVTRDFSDTEEALRLCLG